MAPHAELLVEVVGAQVRAARGHAPGRGTRPSQAGVRVSSTHTRGSCASAALSGPNAPRAPTVPRRSQADVSVRLALLAAGFLVADTSSPGAALRATRPAYEAAPIARRKRAADSSTSPPSSRAVWGALASACAPLPADLIDESMLLGSESLARAAAAASAGGCETKPRACKNCSCGRAARESAPAAVVAAPSGAEAKPEGKTEREADMAVSSACGNCYKGDAFRCGGCPFRGRPAFKPGEERVLLDMDATGDDLGAPVAME
jgi:hypothetical protein